MIHTYCERQETEQLMGLTLSRNTFSWRRLYIHWWPFGMMQERLLAFNSTVAVTSHVSLLQLLWCPSTNMLHLPYYCTWNIAFSPFWCVSSRWSTYGVSKYGSRKCCQSSLQPLNHSRLFEVYMTILSWPGRWKTHRSERIEKIANFSPESN